MRFTLEQFHKGQGYKEYLIINKKGRNIGVVYLEEPKDKRHKKQYAIVELK